MKQRGIQDVIKIYVRQHNGNGFPVEIDSKCVFRQLVRIINSAQLDLPNQYNVLFKGKPIEDYDWTLEQLKITQNSILHIEESCPDFKRDIKMDVCISLQGELLIVKSSGTETVYKLKQTIYKLTKIKPKDQVLVFNGKKLERYQTLSFYKICPNSLICLISTAHHLENSEVLSDYDNIIASFIPRDSTLLESVVSLGEKKTTTSKATLFRSDSIDKKNVELSAPIEVQIRQNNENMSVSDDREFRFDLFKSIGIGNPLSLSVDNCGPLKHSFKFNLSNEKSFWQEIKEQEY